MGCRDRPPKEEKEEEQKKILKYTALFMIEIYRKIRMVIGA